MRRANIIQLASPSAVLLCALIFAIGVAAHGGHGASEMSMDMGMNGEDEAPETEYLPTYFAHGEHAALMFSHIGFMTVSWVLVLPVAVVLSLVNSRLTFGVQLTFLATNIVGVLLGLVYNAQTPDLYPHNAHHSIGWIITWVSIAHVSVSLVKRLDRRGKPKLNGPLESEHEAHAFIPDHLAARSHFQEYQGPYNDRSSWESTTNPASHTESIRSDSVSTHIGEEDYFIGGEHHDSGYAKVYEDDDESYASPEEAGASSTVSAVRKLAKAVPTNLWKILDMGYRTVDRIILPFGFIAFTTGIVTYGRFFEGNGIFAGLAHWIKGGVFFWLGLFNLGRWAGSFAELGWAWNLRPRRPGQEWRPTAEFVESALIFFYGSTNIFLEHLGRRNDDWQTQDLEHLSITVLFIGGGLCGMLVESTSVRDLLSASISSDNRDRTEPHEREELQPPRTYRFSLNPIPALVILLVGMMMGSHHQSSMISTMIHKQWGNLLSGASIARGLTYAIMYIKPPRSVLPSRPPTELLASFCLIAGGIIFMASSPDTVNGMIHYEIDAMFMHNVTMGLVGILMAWEITVLAIKGWAWRREMHQKVVSLPCRQSA
ncbi:Protein of unknown function (Ytp1) [Emericellopsis cladophorae]|uniref:Integral membrane protein n=1 Tax=Emericellopsis cladophorae TaxID=2686198 RepID=A0A9Q0BBM2_9HYPO|nr:Protein of unknown function (Ytp1) [Emericellopsis cladophorae]KAI6779467.1 Protein of unknown function (Ytp1) [Emericellopsis cladophorae]